MQQIDKFWKITQVINYNLNLFDKKTLFWGVTVTIS